MTWPFLNSGCGSKGSIIAFSIIDLACLCQADAAYFLPARMCHASSLAWLLAQGEDIIPIPGTKRRKYLEEKAAAVNIKLSPGDLRRIQEAAPHGAAAGLRYPEGMMQLVSR